MKTLLTVLCLVLLMASCEPYEPMVIKVQTSAEEGKTGVDTVQGEVIRAYANGAEYVLYFAGDGVDFEPLYRGSQRYTGEISIPDISPLDLWLVTTPSVQDSVWLEVGCIHVATVNRVRMVVR